MDIGDWLYVIIIVVAAISSLFSSKKKKKPTQVLGQPESRMDTNTDQPAVEEEEKGFWELFKELQQEQPNPQPKPVVTPPPPVRQKAKPAAVSPSRKQKDTTKIIKKTFHTLAPSPFLEAELQSSRSRTRDLPAMQVMEDENYLFGDEDFHDLQELKKAIVYTEILNRRY